MKLTKSKLKEIVKEEIKSLNEKRVKRGSKITYMRHFAFGKKGKETAGVMAIRGNDVLLDNGEQLDLRDIEFNKKKYKVESINEGKETANSLIKKMKKISDFKKYWADPDQRNDPVYENVPAKLFKKHFGLDPKELQKIDQWNINVMRVGKVDLYNESINEGFTSSQIKKAIGIAKQMSGNMTGAAKKIEKLKKGLSQDSEVKDALKAANESINEGNPTSAVQKKLIKIFQNDPLYKDVIMAKNSKDFKKAIDTLRSIRGPNAIKLLKKHSKKLMGKDY